MTERITLYQFNSPDIKITIEARFEDDKLIIEGYDIGKNVEKAWGDSDYEYTMTLAADSVGKLCNLLNIQSNSHNELLAELKKRFHTNSCFSEISKFLTDNNIKHDGFSWS